MMMIDGIIINEEGRRTIYMMTVSQDGMRYSYRKYAALHSVSLYKCSKLEMRVDIGRDGSGLQSGDNAFSSKVSIQKVFEKERVGNRAFLGRSQRKRSC